MSDSKPMPKQSELPPKSEKQFTSINLGDLNPTDPISQVLAQLKKSQDDKAIKLAFEADPTKTDNYASVYQRRTNLMPPALLKRIRDSEELIGGVILPVRARQGSLFARPRANRFDIGFTINLKPDIISKFSEAEQKKIKDNIIPKLRDILLNCGKTSGISDKDKRTLGQTFMEIIEDFLTFGAFAVEVRKDKVGDFHSFKAIDTGTIYFTTKQKGEGQEAENIRIAARKLMSQLQGVKVDMPTFEKDGYTYVQVIDDLPRQVFTDDELLYWSGAPSTDIQRSGYPITPIERVVSAITTHINLTTHNKMYFINGRATRNILVFKSQNLEEGDITSIKSQMIAHINSSNAAFRMPVFGMEPTDELDVVPLEPSGSRDMEFQYLADLNKRMIFAAFQMSPDEVSALSYLSRGTNSQALSESNNEWKLIASRDTGLRPLLLSIEDFINLRLLPKINKEWADLVQINLEGLDADSPEKEATRLQQDSAIFMTMNDIMERVEKEDVHIGGDFPLNAPYLQIIEKYYTKGQILKAFGGPAFKDADKDPALQYYMGDQAWFTMQEMQQQKEQMAAQQNQPGSENAQQLTQGQDLDSAMGQLGASLSKSEKLLPASRKELLKRHTIAKKKIMDQYTKESKELLESIMGAMTGKKDDHDDH